MKLWLIRQDHNTDYGTYDSAVVAAESEEGAIRTAPDGEMWWGGMWMREIKDGPRKGERYRSDYHGWADPQHVTAVLIGEAAEGTEHGVICASFNAG